MPIYEYHCSKCGDFEVTQKMSDEPLRVCPTCRRKVTKLISATSFHLKGSGWYVTDYARKGQGTGSHDGGKKSEPSAGKESSPDASSSKPSTSKDGGDAKDGPKPSKSKAGEKAAAA
jgi:putative FmdB family regulatory protein